MRRIIEGQLSDEKGNILASSFVRATSERGESKGGLREVIEREYNESTDEVEQDASS